jgi:hypothetical protein
MTRFFSLLFFVVGLTAVASAQSGTFNPKEPNSGNKGIVYDRETAFDLTLFGNGYELGVNIGKLKTYYRTEYFHFGIGELKHNREFKNRDGIVGGGGSRGLNNSSYVYGKQNSLYTLRAAYGIKRYYTEKARKKGLAIGVSYQGGPTIGLLKPYMLELNRTEVGGSNNPSIESFNGDNANFFLNTDRIIGAAPFINGIGDISVRPGINFSGAIHFDWGAFDQYVKAVEVGIAADIFFSDVPILIDDVEFSGVNVLPENVKNRPYFLNLYISFQLGKRN